MKVRTTLQKIFVVRCLFVYPKINRKRKFMNRKKYMLQAIQQSKKRTFAFKKHRLDLFEKYPAIVTSLHYKKEHIPCRMCGYKDCPEESAKTLILRGFLCFINRFLFRSVPCAFSHMRRLQFEKQCQVMTTYARRRGLCRLSLCGAA